MFQVTKARGTRDRHRASRAVELANTLPPQFMPADATTVERALAACDEAEQNLQAAIIADGDADGLDEALRAAWAIDSADVSRGWVSPIYSYGLYNFGLCSYIVMAYIGVARLGVTELACWCARTASAPAVPGSR